MIQTSTYEAQLMMRMLVEERHREADRQRLLRQVKSDRPGGLSLQGLRFLHRLGCLLIALGQRLLQSASGPAEVLGSEERTRA